MFKMKFFIYILAIGSYSKKTTDYASSVSGSFIMDASDDLISTNAILNPRNDYYMLGPCKPTWIVIKLSREIKITEIEIQNCEWLSNFVKAIKFYVFVDGEFKKIFEEFNCAKTRNKIVFNVDTKYYSSTLKMEMCEFNGYHSFFTLSNLKVFGFTMIEDFISTREPKNDVNLNLYDVFSTKISNLEQSAETVKGVAVMEQNLDKMKYILVCLLTIIIAQFSYIIFKKSR